MRATTCECGHTLRGENDEELFRLGKEHIRDDQLRELIASSGRDE